MKTPITSIVCLLVIQLSVIAPGAQDEKDSIVRLFRAFSFTPWDMQVHLYDELGGDRRKGVWRKHVHIRDNDVVYKNSFFPLESRKHYRVIFNDMDRPIKIISSEDTREYNVLEYNSANELTRLVRRDPQGMTESRIRYRDGRIEFIEHFNAAGRLLYSENYYYKDREIKVMSFFPRGRLKKLSVFRQDSRGNILVRERTYRIRNADLLQRSEGSEATDLEAALDETYMQSYHEITNLEYASFTNWDRATGWKRPGMAESSLLVEERGDTPYIDYLRNNSLATRIYLNRKFSREGQIDQTWLIYNDGESAWSDYEIIEYDSVNPGIVIRSSYRGGLLRDRTVAEDEIEMHRIKYLYYPNRRLMETVISVKGKVTARKQVKDMPVAKQSAVLPVRDEI